MTTRTLERAAGATALAAMLATPFVPPRSGRRLALTWATVIAGATRTWAIERRSRGAAAASVTACGVAAGTLVAEAWGTRTGRLFGVYRYTGRLRPHVWGVPTLVPLAWYAVAVPARTVGDRALGPRSSPSSRVGVGTLALAAWDLFLDPQMIVEGYWWWPQGGRYRGVPIRNFLGWVVVAAAVMAWLEVAAAGDDDAHLVTYGSLGILETVAFSTFWRDPLVAAVGGIGMLPLAGTALVR